MIKSVFHKLFPNFIGPSEPEKKPSEYEQVTKCIAEQRALLLYAQCKEIEASSEVIKLQAILAKLQDLKEGASLT